MTPTPAHIKFLEELRDSGLTNMWGASPFLKREFPELTTAEADAVLCAWIDSHG